MVLRKIRQEGRTCLLYTSFTIGNTHYVQYGDELVPAAQTEFAKDKSFGYTHSDLPGYIEEKTGGRYPASGVTCIADMYMNNEAIIQEVLSAGISANICCGATQFTDGFDPETHHDLSLIHI